MKSNFRNHETLTLSPLLSRSTNPMMNPVRRKSRSGGGQENAPPSDRNIPTSPTPLPKKSPAKLKASAAISRSDGQESRSTAPDPPVKVVVRVRPVIGGEKEGDRIVRNVSADSVAVGDRVFKFDAVFDSKSTQGDVFQAIGVPLVKDALEGYNASILTYGQTGCGKTYTMWGPPSAIIEEHQKSSHQGIVPRVFSTLFTEIEKAQNISDSQVNYQCRCSFLEIYNEQVSDLLDSTQRNLQIRDDVKNGFYVENLTEEYVTNLEDVTQILIKGLSNRKVGATSTNLKGSRSHAVFTCIIESWSKGTSSDSFSSSRTSRISFVDLAGLESSIPDGAAMDYKKESKIVKFSLSQLGNLVNILANVPQSEKSQNIPHKNSSLTHLLRESLGGNAKLTIVCAISPDARCKSDTMSTLRFGQRARLLENKPVINEITEDDVNDLTDQIRQLKEELIRTKSYECNSVGSGEYFKRHNARASLNILRASLNRSLILPHIDEAAEHDVDFDEADVKELCNQLGNLQPSVEEDTVTGSINCTQHSLSPSGKSSYRDAEDLLDGNICSEESELEEVNSNNFESELPSDLGVCSDVTASPLPCSRGSLSIIPCRNSLLFHEPTLSESPKISNSQNKTPINLPAHVYESSNSNLEVLRHSTNRSDPIRSSLQSSNVYSSAAESLAASLHRGLQIIDQHQHMSASRKSSVSFSFEHLASRPWQAAKKIDSGMQTLADEGLSSPSISFLCSSCKKMVQDNSDLKILSETRSPKALEKTVADGDESLSAGSSEEAKDLGKVCMEQEAKIKHLTHLVEQYELDHKNDLIVEKSQDSRILTLEGSKDHMPLADETKHSSGSYPEVSEGDCVHTFDVNEREALLKDIQNLRTQLQLRNDNTFQYEAGEEDFERERQRWTEMESRWICLAEELRIDLESKRRTAEKAELELSLEKKCSAELDDALHRAIMGHARMVEHYADLQEKHDIVLQRYRKIMEGIAEVKKAAVKAGGKRSGAKFVDSLAKELSALRVERERERNFLKQQNRNLKVQLRDTAEAVHAAGELLVRLKEAEEAASVAEEKHVTAQQEMEKMKKQMEKMKRKHAMEIATMKHYLADSRLPESALRPIFEHESIVEPETRTLARDDDQDWRAAFGPSYR
ncbi:Kinesin-like protein KIN12B [Acorus calamus]|uniref:Kinesin-like protein KIN12B n=1 Tax=Acorus calamus TaxID=4465 RepID=A0AAV9DWW7_ACOCL|nr:Kinesin-like protein KIN12B [Acorus calamus]